MLTREGGRDAALRFQMDAESCEPAEAGRGGGRGVLRGKCGFSAMEEDDFSRCSLPRGRG